jgi:hypothetical protein
MLGDTPLDLAEENARLRGEVAALRLALAERRAGAAGAVVAPQESARLERLAEQVACRMPPRSDAHQRVEEHGVRLTGFHAELAELLRHASCADLRAEAPLLRERLSAPDGAPYKLILKAACADAGVRSFLLRCRVPAAPRAGSPTLSGEAPAGEPLPLILPQHAPAWARLLRIADAEHSAEAGCVLYVLHDDAVPQPTPLRRRTPEEADFGAAVARALGAAWGWAPEAVQETNGDETEAALMTELRVHGCHHVRPAPLLLALWAGAHGDDQLAAHLRKARALRCGRQRDDSRARVSFRAPLR